MLDLLTVKILLHRYSTPSAARSFRALSASRAGPLWLRQSDLAGACVAFRPAVNRRTAQSCSGILLVATGAVLFRMGLLAEPASIYHESQSKPIYVIRENLEQPARVRYAEPRWLTKT